MLIYPSKGAIATSYYAKCSVCYEGLGWVNPTAGDLEFSGGLAAREEELMFIRLFDSIQARAGRHAKSSGFRDLPGASDPLNRIMLMVTELSEAVEAYRKDPEASSEHIPGFTGPEEEFADTVIRIMDWANMQELSVGEAIIAKIFFNASRPRLHGGKRA